MKKMNKIEKNIQTLFTYEDIEEKIDSISSTNSGKKVTFYIPNDLVDCLDNGWMKLRKMFRGDAKITKSSIVIKCIQIIIDDFFSRGESSEIYLRLREDSPLTEEQEDDDRLTLRIPKNLLQKVDARRHGRLGKVSRNLCILEMLDKSLRE